MINLSYYTYRRNHYYNGKLLSASELEAEQKYHNDKRRLGNRFLHGFGVVCGMQVVALAPDRISVEPGMALDGYGREIVLAKPDVRRLVDLDGYTGEGPTTQYLYVEYDERPVEQAQVDHFGMDSGAGRGSYNHVAEVYSLYLSDRQPEPDTGTVEEYYRARNTIYQDRRFRVEIWWPRYLASGKPFYLTLRVVPEQVELPFTLSMKLGLHCIRHQGKDVIDVHVNSQNMRMVNGGYQVRYLCQSMNITEDLARIQVNPATFDLESQGNSGRLSQPVQLQAILTDRPVEDCVTEDYGTRIFPYASYRPCRDVCLAALTYDGRGRIQNIQERPFGQQVRTSGELVLENLVLKDRLAWMEQKLLEKEANPLTGLEQDSSITMATGDAVIRLGIGGKTGQRFFSQEIAHGLGLGKVTIVLGVEEEDAAQGGVVYGSSEIFDQREAVVMAETAARLDPQKGTFVIGARLLEPTTQYELKIHWTALRYEDQKKLAQEKKILIDTPSKSLRVMESVYLAVKFVQMNPTDLIWSVVGENSGSINASGCYTAPNHPGVYEVQAVCAYDPNLRANAFLVVKP